MFPNSELNTQPHFDMKGKIGLFLIKLDAMKSN